MSVLQKNKKVAAGVGITAVAAAALALGAGTYAAYTDSETTQPNTFASGSMDLQISNEVEAPPFRFENFNPGDSVDQGIDLNNAGTVSGSLSVTFAVTGSENSCVEPETDAENPCDDGSELVEKAIVKVNGNAIGTLADLNGKSFADFATLEPGKPLALRIAVELPEATGNEVMTDDAVVKATLTLKQITS